MPKLKLYVVEFLENGKPCAPRAFVFAPDCGPEAVMPEYKGCNIIAAFGSIEEAHTDMAERFVASRDDYRIIELEEKN